MGVFPLVQELVVPYFCCLNNMVRIGGFLIILIKTKGFFIDSGIYAAVLLWGRAYNFQIVSNVINTGGIPIKNIELFMEIVAR